jgi:hypothetical protein
MRVTPFTASFLETFDAEEARKVLGLGLKDEVNFFSLKLAASLTAQRVRADLDGPIILDVLNNSGATLERGVCVYATGVIDGVVTVAEARSDSSSKMPALGVVSSIILNGEVGTLLLLI